MYRYQKYLKKFFKKAFVSINILSRQNVFITAVPEFLLFNRRRSDILGPVTSYLEKVFLFSNYFMRFIFLNSKSVNDNFYLLGKTNNAYPIVSTKVLLFAYYRLFINSFVTTTIFASCYELVVKNFDKEFLILPMLRRSGLLRVLVESYFFFFNFLRFNMNSLLVNRQSTGCYFDSVAFLIKMYNVTTILVCR